MSISQHRVSLLKIQNNISLFVDSGKAVSETLLDLSTAFNTFNPSILHDCLKDWFGVDNTVLTWIDSYLTNCKQKIKLGVF